MLGSGDSGGRVLPELVFKGRKVEIEARGSSRAVSVGCGLPFFAALILVTATAFLIIVSVEPMIAEQLFGLFAEQAKYNLNLLAWGGIALGGTVLALFSLRGN